MKDEEQELRDWHRESLRPPRLLQLRLTDPDRGLPYPPPTIGNIIAACLFAASALAAAFLGARAALRYGPGFILFTVAAAAWPVLLAFGAWRVRPLNRREVAFRRAFAPVLLQALCFAVGGYFAVMTAADRGPGDQMAGILLIGAVFATFAGVVGSVLLQHLGRRADALVLAQLTGPFVTMIGGGLMALLV